MKNFKSNLMGGSALALAIVAASAFTLAGCGSNSTATSNSILATLGGALATVNCTTDSSAANGLADQVITISTTDQAQATKDAQLAAESAALLAAFCPAFKAGAGVVINAVVASNTPTASTGTQVVNGDAIIASAASTPAAAAAKKAAAPGKIVKTDPWTYQIVVPKV